MSAEMRWWRVVLDQNGRIVSCEEVEPSESQRDGSRVYFIQADQRVYAEILAHRRYKENQRLALRERRQAHRDAGLCRCGGKLEAGYKTCKRCRAGWEKSNQRAIAKSEGREVTPPPPKSVAVAETRKARESELVLAVLREVIAIWHSSPTVRTFGEWLEKRLTEAEKLANANSGITDGDST